MAELYGLMYEMFEHQSNPLKETDNVPRENVLPNLINNAKAESKRKGQFFKERSFGQINDQRS